MSAQTPAEQPAQTPAEQPAPSAARRPVPSSVRQSRAAAGGLSSADLLARSDLPRAAKAAIAVSRALGRVALVALVVAVVAVAMGWAPVAWAAVIVLLAWCVSWGIFAGVAAGKWALIGAVAAAAQGTWAVAAGSSAQGEVGALVMIGVPVLGLAVGMVGGAAVRGSWDRRQTERERRLAALPDWARDELGAAADGLDPNATRPPGPAVIGSHSDPAVRLLAAVCRPLPGSTVLAGEPAIAVNGSRVAVVAWGPRLDRAVQAPPLPPLPAGVGARVFVVREGTELASSLDDAPASTPSAAPAGSAVLSGATEIVATEPQELAAHLGAGTPPDGDACHGIAADLHARVLDALDGYSGVGERHG
ncbi:hypothetical protein [Corynebacterium sp. HMSC11E11]|uniref:hypothetical protein n=1 Tax=Corynebacterium sp. HMSC11E11 TaxID=1581089 RepID=UPI0008A29E89|nr:hypothetical protein [Corynebacterium sp. HMSC11E11]OFU52124.1 hypothetical protein HMPREF3121_11595 [Corynebacterium sp. HMSC11E11]